MMNFLTIWRRELAACFLSPIAYVTMVVFLVLCNWTFWNVVQRRVGESESITVLLFMSICLWLPVLITVVTMRLFAEEKRQGTIETLLTAPVSEAQVVMGKYFGALTFVLVVLLPVLGSALLLRGLCPGIAYMSRGGMFGGFLIVVLLSSVCVAVGMIVSMLTRNQIVAALLCFCCIVLPLMSGYIASFLPFGSDRLVQLLSVDNHISDFARGSVDLQPIVLYVSGAAFSLFVAVRLLQWRRWS